MNKLLTSLALLFLALPVLAQSPSAMITHVDGSAIVIVKGEKKPAVSSESLAPETMVELRGGAEMTVVYFAGGTHEHYTGPSLIGIGKKRGKVFDGAQGSRTVTVTDSALVKAIDPNALNESPGNGKLSVSGSSAAPRFSWTTDHPGPYILSVVLPSHGANSRSIVWSKSVGLKSVVYSGPELDPQKAYTAEVQSADSIVAVSQFRTNDNSTNLLSQAQVEADRLSKADPKNPTPHILMSTAYSQNAQHKKAVASLNVAMRTQPSDKSFMKRMNTMMGSISKKADKDTEYTSGYFNAQNARWGTNAYYDSQAWGWEDGWDH